MNAEEIAARIEKDSPNEESQEFGFGDLIRAAELGIVQGRAEGRKEIEHCKHPSDSGPHPIKKECDCFQAGLTEGRNECCLCRKHAKAGTALYDLGRRQLAEEIRTILDANLLEEERDRAISRLLDKETAKAVISESDTGAIGKGLSESQHNACSGEGLSGVKGAQDLPAADILKKEDSGKKCKCGHFWGAHDKETGMCREILRNHRDTCPCLGFIAADIPKCGKCGAELPKSGNHICAPTAGIPAFQKAQIAKEVEASKRLDEGEGQTWTDADIPSKVGGKIVQTSEGPRVIPETDIPDKDNCPTCGEPWEDHEPQISEKGAGCICPIDISQCPACLCMTKTTDLGTCGKCGGTGKYYLKYSLRDGGEWINCSCHQGKKEETKK